MLHTLLYVKAKQQLTVANLNCIFNNHLYLYFDVKSGFNYYFIQIMYFHSSVFCEKYFHNCKLTFQLLGNDIDL